MLRPLWQSATIRIFSLDHWRKIRGKCLKLLGFRSFSYFLQADSKSAGFTPRGGSRITTIVIELTPRLPGKHRNAILNEMSASISVHMDGAHIVAGYFRRLQARN
jgi:hypothetical protein